MRHLMVWAWVVGLLVAGTAGCGGATMADVSAEHARGGGVTRIVDAPAPLAVDAAAAVLRRHGIETLEEHRDATPATLAGTIPATFTLPETRVEVWIEPSGADHASVSVVTKRVHMVATTALTEDTFLRELDAEIAARRSGGAR